MPYANDQLTEIENIVINHVSAFNRDLTVSAPLPGGGRQVTIATAYEPNSRALLHVTLIQYDNHNQPRQIVFADRAEFTADKWTLQNSSVYRFNPDGTHAGGAPHRAAGGRNRREANGSREAHEQRRSRKHEPGADRRRRALRPANQEPAAQIRHDLSGEASAAVCVLRLHSDRDSVRLALDSRRAAARAWGSASRWRSCSSTTWS